MNLLNDSISQININSIQHSMNNYESSNFINHLRWTAATQTFHNNNLPVILEDIKTKIKFDCDKINLKHTFIVVSCDNQIKNSLITFTKQ